MAAELLLFSCISQWEIPDLFLYIRMASGAFTYQSPQNYTNLIAITSHNPIEETPHWADRGRSHPSESGNQLYDDSSI